MRDFAAIDFETANFERSSVCSVGLVFVRGGIVEDVFYSLVRPEPNYYLRRNILVHGLTKRDTDSAPIFPKVWEEVSEKIGGLPLVAHNSPFDESCLRAVFRAYSMDYPEYRFHCTRAAARRFIKSLEPLDRPRNCKLGTLSDFFGVELEHHHNALSDAVACAKIALKLSEKDNGILF